MLATADRLDIVKAISDRTVLLQAYVQPAHAEITTQVERRSSVFKAERPPIDRSGGQMIRIHHQNKRPRRGFRRARGRDDVCSRSNIARRDCTQAGLVTIMAIRLGADQFEGPV